MDVDVEAAGAGAEPARRKHDDGEGGDWRPDQFLQITGRGGGGGSSSFPPLPLLRVLPEEWGSGLSGGQRRRLLRDINAAVGGLSFLHGEGYREVSDRHLSQATEEKVARLRDDVLRRVHLAARRWVDVDCAVHEGEALARLLKGKAGYVPAGSTSVSSYEYSRVSLPEDVRDAPSLESMLPAEARIRLEEFGTHMLLPATEAAIIQEVEGVPGCHTDPILLSRPKAYARLVKRALRIGLVGLTTEPRSTLGIFFVHNKGGNSASSLIAVAPTPCPEPHLESSYCLAKASDASKPSRSSVSSPTWESGTSQTVFIVCA